MRALCVFCASSRGSRQIHQEAARTVGRTFAHRGIELVYGGGRAGLMGLVADACLEAGGRVTGVMTRALVESEIAHTGLTRLDVVETMHERKTRMSELSDGFVTLPGGPGTLEEIFEQWTWGLLGIHRKPCGFLNVDGYFDPFRGMMEHMVDAAFLTPPHRDMLAMESDIESLLDRFDAYAPPLPKYATPEAS